MSKHKKNTHVNNKSTFKISIVYVLCAFTLLILSLTLVMTYRQNNLIKIPEEEELYQITYEYGGGFGTRIGTMMRKVRITNTGAVNISVDDDKLPSLDYWISKDSVKSLKESLFAEGFLNLNEDQAQKGCMDGPTYYLEYKDPNMQKRVGGYCAVGGKFAKCTSKVRELLSDFIEDYEDHISEYDNR